VWRLGNRIDECPLKRVKCGGGGANIAIRPMVKAVSMAANLIAAATAADRPHDTCIGIFAKGRKQTASTTTIKIAESHKGHSGTKEMTSFVKSKPASIFCRGNVTIFGPGINQKSQSSAKGYRG